MGAVFQVRGTQLAAYYSTNGSYYNFTMGNSTEFAPSVIADSTSGVFGSSLIQFRDTSGSQYSSIAWPGYNNFSATNKLSVILRIVPRWTGFPSAQQVLFYAGSIVGVNAGLRIQLDTAGKFVVYAGANHGSGALLNFTTTSTWSATSGTPQDIKLTWDGTITTNACVIAIDETTFETKNASAKWSDYSQNRNTRNIAFISCGSTPTVANNSKFDINEIVIFDNVESIAGSARTGFYSLSAFDGTSSTDPGVANVRNGTGYTIAGVSKTGTCSVPTAANVRSGTAVDATTGTAAIPTAANVRFGTATDATTGTLVVPQASTVLSGTTFDNGTVGTLDVGTIATKVDEIWKVHGLDSSNPMTVTTTRRTAGTINQTLTGDGTSTTTVTRT